MSFDTTIWGNYGQEKVVGSTKLHEFGQKMQMSDGRIFRYFRADGTAIVPGKIYQGKAGEANTAQVNDLAPSGTNAAGARQVVLTMAGTALAGDVFNDGYLTTGSSVGTGRGYTYKIATATTAAAGSTVTVTLAGNDSLVEALESGTTKIGLRKNEYDNILLTTADTVSVNTLVGVPAASAAASFYGWAQRRGIVAVYTDATTPIIGEPITVSSTVAGAIAKFQSNTVATSSEATTAEITKRKVAVGYLMSLAASIEYSTVDLTLE